MPNADKPSDRKVSASKFPSTRWSMVLAAAGQPDASASTALEWLCATYRYPVYAYARRLGKPTADAEDLTQGFFLRFIEQSFPSKVSPDRGKFRHYLLVSFRNFVAEEGQRERALKRGGGRLKLSLGSVDAEDRFCLEVGHAADPEAIFELSWASTVIDRTLHRLAEEFAAAGKGDLFASLKPHLLGEQDAPNHAVVATRFGMTEGAIAAVVHRARTRYRHLFREEIASTVSSRHEFEEELRHVFSVIGQHERYFTAARS
jgi:RNA polymerase sigma-70 factor (ECF subfamily)